MIEIYKTGTRAVTKIGKVEGIFTAVSIRGAKILYELSYFIKGDHKSCWLTEDEFDVADVSRIKIGYKNE